MPINPFEEDPPDVPAPTQVRANVLKARTGGAEIGDIEPPPEPEPEPVQPPATVDTPQLSGIAAVGETLSCSMGNWTGEPTSYAYGWKSQEGMSGPIDLPAAGDTYVVDANDAGMDIFCVVTATNDAGSTEGPASNAVSIPSAT